MIYFCCDQYRRDLVIKDGELNGIDFLEVLDGITLPLDQRQRTLYVHFLNENHLADLTKENIRIYGGERIRDITVSSEPEIGPEPLVLAVKVDRYGDFSTYTLRLGKKDNPDEVPDGFDPVLSTINFSFKAGCPSDFDCREERVFPIEPDERPDINYLSKDYAGFRQLMLDRMALLMPQWRERNPADIGIALVEALAYIGDYLSYRQDAVATEAYLGTARSRVSVRRHARLVDYFMHDGCNARAWVQIDASGSGIRLTKGTPLLTKIPGVGMCIERDSAVHREAMMTDPVVFETMHDVTLYHANNAMEFYTWSDDRCYLPQGATRATLRDEKDKRLLLRRGDVLILEEVADREHGNPAYADLPRRHAVRLVRVKPEAKLVDGEMREPEALREDPLTKEPIVEIEWHAEDALPFPLCLWRRVKDDKGRLRPVSHACGNVVLADHGRTLPEETIGTVASSTLLAVTSQYGDPCNPPATKTLPARFRPRLSERPLTHHAPYESASSARASMRQNISAAVPDIRLRCQLEKFAGEWKPRKDIMGSDGDAAEYVVETENDGTAYLRFGDDTHGRRPEQATTFNAVYRVGNGSKGNIGAETLYHIVCGNDGIERVRNPLPAAGGLDPERMEDVRQKAPFAFRTQERAVTPEDYAAMTERHPEVQKAAATFRWTGSWRTVFVTVDRFGGLPVDDSFRKEIRMHLERYRLAGYDIEIDEPRHVPLQIDMTVCIKPHYFRDHVRTALLEVLSNRALPDGGCGVFHPDRLTFGQTIYLSPIYAAAQAVEGVASVQITKFQRMGTDSNNALDTGKLSLGRLEIARLDNDPNFQERGLLRLSMEGGK